MEGKPKIALMTCANCGYSHLSNQSCPKCGYVASEEPVVVPEPPVPVPVVRSEVSPPARRVAHAEEEPAGSGLGEALKRMLLGAMALAGLGLCVYTTVQWESLTRSRHYYDDYGGRPRPSRQSQRELVNTFFTLSDMENR